MRRLAAGLMVAAAAFAGCSSKTNVTAPSIPPVAQPKTAPELKAMAQLHFNSFSSGDFGTFWDDFDSASKSFITRDEYDKRLTACMSHDPNRAKPFKVDTVTDNHDGTWTVAVGYVQYEIKFPARYESGYWRFVLAPDARSALSLPFDKYVATKCAKG